MAKYFYATNLNQEPFVYIFTNDGKVRMTRLKSRLSDGDLMKKTKYFYDCSLPYDGTIKEALKDKIVVETGWIPDLTEEQESEIIDMATEFEDQDDFIESYLSAGYEEWHDTCPENDDEPDTEGTQLVIKYLASLFQKSREELSELE